ncbi:MAG: monooxygenase family protein [Gammaproteobacteria bacterium]
MTTKVPRHTVDLSAYPDLVVIYLGMRVNALRGLKTIMGLGPQIQAAGDAQPEGLLHCEQNIIYRMFPFEIGMRWYWKDFESMEAWTRSPPHREWWTKFLKDSGGTGFWHETYCMRGGIEAIYDDLADADLGLLAFAPRVPARSGTFSARRRLQREGADPGQPEGMSEQELHGSA